MEEKDLLTRRLLLLLAIGGGLSCANVFYNQPILPALRDTFGITDRQVGMVPFVFQAGYAVGMLLLVPLADRLERRRIILAIAGASLFFLLGVAAAPSFASFLVAAFGVGLTSTLPQFLIPLAAALTTEKKRGGAIGVVATGVLMGLLLARTFSGIISQLVGWRTVFLSAMGFSLVLLGLLYRELPESRSDFRGSYGELVKSMFFLLRDEPMLRQVALSAGLMFAGMCTFWGALDFLLEGPPFQLGSTVAGMFGLVGAAGAMAAPLGGKLADRRPPLLIAGIGIALCFLGYGVAWLGAMSLFGLAAGIFIMDFGVQGAHIANQTGLYRLAPDARSRIASMYCFCTMFGSSVGAYLGVEAWVYRRWPGVCAMGIGLLTLSFLVLLRLVMVTAPGPGPVVPETSFGS